MKLLLSVGIGGKNSYFTKKKSPEVGQSLITLGGWLYPLFCKSSKKD